MDRSLFPVPEKKQLSFCSDNNGVNDFFDDMVAIERLAKKVFFGVIITLAILAMIPMGYREFRRWHSMVERAHLIKEDAYDQLDARMAPLYDFLGAAPNPIPLKAALKAQGLGADLRLPLLPLEAPLVQRVDAILDLVARAEADALAARRAA